MPKERTEGHTLPIYSRRLTGLLGLRHRIEAGPTPEAYALDTMHVRFDDMQIRFADIEIDTQRFLLRRAGERVPLRPKVFDLLIHLARHRERVVSREELVELLWGTTVVGSGSLSGLVNELRAALGESGGMDSSIRTVHARGYQFVAEVREVEDDDRSALFDALGVRAAGEAPLSAELVEEIRERLSVFMREEIRPIVEIEGFEPLSGPIVESLFLHLTSMEGRFRSRERGSGDGRTNIGALRLNRRMRVTRSTSSRKEKGAG